MMDNLSNSVEGGETAVLKNHQKSLHHNNKCNIETDAKKIINNNFIISEKMETVDDILKDSSEIQRFYSGRNILVTGATGYMGKVLIEKLLRSCPDLGNVYMIVREKKGRNMDQRLTDLTNSPCFDRIKKELPKFQSKLIAVAGDIGLKELGLSEIDKHLLAQQVDIVFHVAATVRFDEQLTIAILQNVRGTREVLNLCRSFKKLKSVIHVSTAYANCPSLHIEERFYDVPITSQQVIQIAESLDKGMMDHLTQSLIGVWPNSYAFTKAVSEDVVKHYGQGLPVGVFRPGIVVCTKSEPMPGWIDNMYGPSGVIAGVTSGLVRTIQLDLTKPANLVPCDMAINALIAAAWDVANKSDVDIPVFNYVVPSDNPITWHQYVRGYISHGINWPTSRAIWYWSLTCSAYRPMYLMYRIFLHMLPALLMDMALIVINKPTQMIRAYQKLHKFLAVIAYFTSHMWRFETGNVTDLWKSISPRDRELFPFDMSTLDWESYIESTCSGLRQYLLKDPPETLEASKIRMKRLYWLHRFTQCLIACVVVWTLFSMFTLILSPSSSSIQHFNIMDKDTSITAQKLSIS